MRIFKLRTSALTASIALTTLVGCGGSSQMTPTSLAQSGAGSPPIQGVAFQNGRLDGSLATRGGIVSAHGPARPSFMDPGAVGKPLVFVSYGGTIDIYLQRGKNKLVGQIPAGGTDLATDAAGDLYSANPIFSSDSGNVTIYAPPYTDGPKLTLSGSSALVAVSRQGIVAVGTDGCDLSSSPCSFRFYPSGSTTPCATVALDQAAFPNGVYGAAFDRRGNLYAASSGSGTEAPLNVGKIDGGCNATKAKILTTTNSIPYAASIRVDKAGRIAIFTATSDLKTDAIDSYDPPKGASLGNPVSTTPLPGSNYNGTFAFQASGLGLWAANFGVGSSYRSGASEYAYPAGGAPQKTIVGAPQSVAYGVAVTPALVP
jgi:hypothetical protein